MLRLWANVPAISTERKLVGALLKSGEDDVLQGDDEEGGEGYMVGVAVVLGVPELAADASRSNSVRVAWKLSWSPRI